MTERKPYSPVRPPNASLGRLGPSPGPGENLIGLRNYDNSIPFAKDWFRNGHVTMVPPMTPVGSLLRDLWEITLTIKRGSQNGAWPPFLPRFRTSLCKEVTRGSAVTRKRQA